MNENCAALPQNGDALRAGMRAEEAHRRISEHEDRCFKQGQETKAAVDDLHRRVDEVHGRVNEVRQELGRDLSDGFRSLDNRIAEQALAQKGNWLKVAGRILIILGTAAVSLFVGSLIK